MPWDVGEKNGKVNPMMPMRRIFVVLSSCCLLALCALLVLMGREDLVPESSPLRWEVAEGHGFVLDTPGCRIPAFDPYDPSLLPLIAKTGPYLCPGRPSFLMPRPNAEVALDEDSLALYYGGRKKGNFSCTYKPILRDSGPDTDRTDSRYRLGASRPLQLGVPLEDEFLQVRCSLQDPATATSPNFTQYLPLTPLKTLVEEEKDKLSSGAAPLSVIMLGIDSISKLNFVRHFRRTHALIREKMKFVELRGYTKVADNTFPNLVPLLSGRFIERFWNESVRDAFFFDAVPFIWKSFSRRGHRTLFAEDAPQIATFNYLKRGFRDPPADYYFRPFALALEKSTLRHTSKANCLGSQLEMDLLYEYTKNFVRTMGPHRPLFSFTFLARLTHDTLNAAGHADDPTYELLRDLHEEGHLNRSVLVLFSDHGIRFGPIRQTYIGKFEERMPFLFLLFPAWFLRQHPRLSHNLRINQDRLTTPFDVHATLEHLLDLHQPPPVQPHGISLFTEIPTNRTCERASVLPHWCPCQTRTPLKVDGPRVRRAALALIRALNEILRPHASLCRALVLDRVIDARLGEPNDAVLRFVKHQNDVIGRHVVLGDRMAAPGDYLLVVRARPGGGVFEGTVRFDEGTYKVLDDVSRLDRYGNQSACITNARLRKFCYCRARIVVFRTSNATHPPS